MEKGFSHVAMMTVDYAPDSERIERETRYGQLDNSGRVGDLFRKFVQVIVKK